MYFPITKQKDHPNFVEVKGHKCLSFFHFPQIRAGKSVKQVNKIELPNSHKNLAIYTGRITYSNGLETASN